MFNNSTGGTNHLSLVDLSTAVYALHCYKAWSILNRHRWSNFNRRPQQTARKNTCTGRNCADYMPAAASLYMDFAALAERC